MSKELQKTATPQKRTSNLKLTIVGLLKDGQTPCGVCSKLNLKHNSLSYYLKQLQIDGIIKKIGYATWEVNNDNYFKFLYQKNFKKQPPGTISSHPPQLQKDIRGHGFQVTLKIPKLQWTAEKREQYLKLNNLPFKSISLGKTQSFIFKECTTWLSNESIVIYWNRFKHYYGESAKESKNLFIYDLTRFFISLQAFLKVSLRTNNKFMFKLDKKHYGKIKDDLARQYNKEGKKLRVADENGEWLLIDDSWALDEIETVHKDTAEPDMDNVVKPFLNQLKKTKLMPEDILSMFSSVGNNLNNIAEIQKISVQKEEFYAEHHKAHAEAIIELKDTFTEWRLEMKKDKTKAQKIREKYPEYF